MFQKTTNKLLIHSRWKIALKTIPFVIIILFLKFIAHYFGYEFLTLNSLFTAIISANIFLIGFLISGTLVDYKESEKLPSDLSASLETMADEAMIIYKNKKSKEAKEFLLKLSHFNTSLIAWFYKKEKTNELMDKLSSFNNDFLAFENQTQANFIVRLKQEQNLIRKVLKRIATVRDTSFLGTGYVIAEIMTLLLVLSLVFIQMNPFYEGAVFVFIVSFILIYMNYFIKDLDNPFEYNKDGGLDNEVSLKPILDSQERLNSYYKLT
ncbi:MAG: hypothetical protein KBC19_04945 [Candidatus Moranbacteria bacterium]|nr:hypothetical protein [Candidatus Moranbacteria bacterium]